MGDAWSLIWDCVESVINAFKSAVVVGDVSLWDFLIAALILGMLMETVVFAVRSSSNGATDTMDSINRDKIRSAEISDYRSNEQRFIREESYKQYKKEQYEKRKRGL